MSKILITTSSFNIDTPEIEAIKSAGYEIVPNPHKRRLTEGEVAELLTADITGLIAGVEPLTKAVIDGAEGLRVISRCGAGTDSVDMDAATARSIKVFNTPDAPTKAVAELTIGLMLSVLRGIPLQDRTMRAGGWERPMGGLLGARTVGLIGLGRIGSCVAQYAAGFGAKILAYDPVCDHSDVAKIVDMEVLLETSDIISLHIPYNEDNRHLINRERLTQMKPSAILVNASRGGLVDEQAIADALESGDLAGAAFDVFEEEPYKGPLTGLDNVVLTAHVGSYAREARQQQESEAARNLLAGLSSEEEGIKAYG